MSSQSHTTPYRNRKNDSGRTAKAAVGGIGGATVGGIVGSKIGIAALGTAIAGTVPLAVIGGIAGAILLAKKRKRS